VVALHYVNTSAHQQASDIRKKHTDTGIRGTAQAPKQLPDQLQEVAEAYVKRLKPTSSLEKLRDGALFTYSAYMGNAVRSAFCMAEIGDRGHDSSDSEAGGQRLRHPLVACPPVHVDMGA
jgi:hypothetical protein